MVAKENWMEKKKIYKEKYEDTTKEKWNLIKKENNLMNLNTPDRLIENGKILYKPKDIVNSMNRQFLKKIKQIQKEVPVTNNDLLVNYRCHIGSRI